MRRQESSFWDWLLESQIRVVDFAVEDIPSMRKWRADYDDREVDFADATLVWLAKAYRTNLVATRISTISRPTDSRTANGSGF